MEILKKLFKKKELKKEPEDIMKIANVVGPLVDKTVWDIFITYKVELLSEPITYIVPAVWGVQKDGELTPVQKAIHHRVAPVIKEIFESLLMKDMGGAQEFALNFLIRGIIISKIAYMIEAFRCRLNERSMDDQSLKEAIIRLKPLGSA